MEYGLILYLVVVNLIGFSLMGLDKWKAKHKKWRIAERTFFGIAIVGGSLGTWAGMYAFCHKTRHWYFVVGMPLILAIQAAVWLLTFGK
ncbi:DUF1294 domain-containing protein [Petralouisia muris]|uniref:DUF1294 domain-containing protein n=1 Tax=Petralouisia muris TaxID=3032872 RepID=A0AC61RZL0_9FIRM|nr:DUF1294 domain-containing protein [Petralouisia muris]